VVTVVRNDLEGLKKTRKSLEGQKYKNWSHIVIDGDSKDGTNEFLKLLPSENTIYVSEQDNGIYNAMNKGWKLAVPNSFVYFLNARDVFATNISLAKAAESLNQAANTMWGCTTHEEINEDGTGWVCKLVAPPSIPNQLYAYGYRSHQAVVMRKELISELGGFDETYKIASDWDLIVRAINYADPTIWVHPLGRFELGGLSSKNILQAHIELKEIRRRYLVFTLEQKLLDGIWCGIHLHVLGYKNFFTRVFKKRLTGRKRKTRVRLFYTSGLFTQINPTHLRFLRILGLRQILKPRRHDRHTHFGIEKFVNVVYITMFALFNRQIRKCFNIHPLGAPMPQSELYYPD
jgi:glycosyltransferase involved in cell wall biosynthesis